ncbi:MAG TPA: archaetidylserine decarboxylase [Gammaproteobacteria bacterium]|nr:archaetidylserine decarboxylase [Gammaproteobacteria bacterium]
MSRDTGPARAGDYLRALPLYPLPHHLLSRLMLGFTRIRQPWVKNAFTRWFAARYGVDMEQALEPDLTAYPDFNSFFTRALRADARPAPADPEAVCSPVDGTVSQLGTVHAGRIFQAKGQAFTVQELLGGDPARAAPFTEGAFATLYLSPRDYHRVHMPVPGRLRETVHVPGRLFSVAPHTTRTIPRLFARNERLAAFFDTPAGPVAVVLVGAIFVACIETVWSGVVTPPRARRVTVRDFRGDARAPELERCQELGRFNMGSTVIVLFGPGRVSWNPELAAGSGVRVGQPIAAPQAGARP